MSHLPAFRYNAQNIGSTKLPALMLTEFSLPLPKTAVRTKIWELSTNLHCSIIGTCLTGAELRQFLHKMGDTDAKTATDHTLHGKGVMSACRSDTPGKMLHKLLDRRHETVIKRFAKMKTADEVRTLWRACVDEGEISGAYWATLTHPLSDRKLVNDVFGEVHMLSHLVGSASRLDIARLQSLQREADVSRQKLAKQHARLGASAVEQGRLQRRIAELEEALVRAQAVGSTVLDVTSSGIAYTAVLNRFAAEAARAETLSSRLAAVEARLRESEQRANAAIIRTSSLQQEVDALEGALVEKQNEDQLSGHLGLQNASVLYVGGRRNLFDRLRSLAHQRGIDLTIHDGGIEDGNSHLPALVGQSDVVVLPIDCVSHAAALMVKRLCRNAGKPFVPLRSASLASFLASLDALEIFVEL